MDIKNEIEAMSIDELENLLYDVENTINEKVKAEQ